MKNFLKIHENATTTKEALGITNAFYSNVQEATRQALLTGWTSTAEMIAMVTSMAEDLNQIFTGAMYVGMFRQHPKYESCMMGVAYEGLINGFKPVEIPENAPIQVPEPRAKELPEAFGLEEWQEIERDLEGDVKDMDKYGGSPYDLLKILAQYVTNPETAGWLGFLYGRLIASTG